MRINLTVAGRPANFVIYAPGYDEFSGGSIVLHKLCHLINKAGHEAYVWPFGVTVEKRIKSFLRLRKKGRGNSYYISPHYPNKIATRRNLSGNSIVIYPEVVAGNPLLHTNVVRWFLHRPGFHTGTIDYGEDELYFFYDDHSNDRNINPDESNKLSVVALNPEYRDLGLKQRSGSCYLMRKGAERELIHDPKNSIKIDGKSHAETARIFNSCEVFYSYDEMTMYSQFAALCGCTSVVVPENYSCREDWVRNHPIGKYGVAYGENDTEHAVLTRSRLRNYFDDQEIQSLLEVNEFIDKSKRHFGL